MASKERGPDSASTIQLPEGGSEPPSGLPPISAEVHGFRDALREDLLQAIRDAVTATARQLVQDELGHLVGEPWSRKDGGNPFRRGGSAPSRIFLDGQPVALRRPRVRDVEANAEVQLETVEALQSRDALDDDVKAKLVRGVSTRKYDGALSSLADGLGLRRSAVSDAFKRAAQKDLDAINGRRLDDHKFLVIYIDGVHFRDVTVIVAMGIDAQGHKVILGLREGATENSTVTIDLLTALQERGLILQGPALFVLDGSKALRSAVLRVFGELAVIQRCLAHKKRNVESYLLKEWHAELRRKLNAAWGMTRYEDAKRALKTIIRWLRNHSEAAANSLAEGLEETLTVHRLAPDISGALRKTLLTTNPIESIFGHAADLTRRVKRWRGEAMVMRWLGSNLLWIEGRFRRVRGYRQLGRLREALQSEAPYQAKVV